MGGVPSVPTDRSRNLQVIGAGFARTGTVSMSLALQKLLDGPVMHGGTHLFGREDAYIKLWCKVVENRHDKPVMMKHLRDATAGFVATTDLPAAWFTRELLELYPDAKVVLVTRDQDRWWASFERIMKSTGITPGVLSVILWPCPTWRWTGRYFSEMAKFDVERLGKDKAVYDRNYILHYNEWVRANVPPEKLITMDIKDGWAPLCDFLGKPVPDGPFPRANDAEAFDEYAAHIFKTAMLMWAGILMGAGVAAWGAWKVWGGR